MTKNTGLVPTSIAFAEESGNTKQTIKNVIKTIRSVVSTVDRSLDFEFDSKTGTITEYNGNDTEVVIPSAINGVAVTSIGSGTFYGYSNLTNVTIPDSVSCIGECAFAYCSSLSSITIPNSVTSIEDGTFANCSNLTSIIIPDSITSIGYEAFTGCSGLTNITIPSSIISIGEYAFEGCEKAVYYVANEEIEQPLIDAV